MLAKILGGLAATASTGLEALGDMGEALIQEIKEIPEALEKGWNEGLTEPKESIHETCKETVPDKEDEVVPDEAELKGFSLPKK